MSQGKGAFITEVSKDRLWKDYVSREDNHQTYWAVEAQYVKGSLSPDKKNILRSVESMGDCDPTVLLGTARGPSSPNATRRHYNSTNTFKTNADPNAPSNLLLRQLQMTAAENTQAEAKTLEQLQNYKHMYSTRAGLKHKADNNKAAESSSSPRSNVATPYTPNNAALLTTRGGLEKERTLNNNYCSYYAGKDIGIHHYKYSPPARSCQGLADGNAATTTAPSVNEGSFNNTIASDNGNLLSTSGSPRTARSMSSSQQLSPAGKVGRHGLPPLPLNAHLLQGPTANNGGVISPFNTSRLYSQEIEEEASVVSPKRPYTEHGLLSPIMGVRIASATARRGYGQRIASSNDVAFAVRPSLELKETSKHGYHKW